MPGYVTGTAYSHPQYSGFADLKNWNDVGVVVLDEPVGIPTARLAPRNYLNQFAQPALNHELFASWATAPRCASRPAGRRSPPPPQSYPVVRRYTDEVGQKLTSQIVQVNGNPNDVRGGGGTCFGDSGGPSFKGGYLTTVTSYGYTANCRDLGGLQRVDIPVVQSWLAGFGVFPAS